MHAGNVVCRRAESVKVKRERWKASDRPAPLRFTLHAFGLTPLHTLETPFPVAAPPPRRSPARRAPPAAPAAAGRTARRDRPADAARCPSSSATARSPAPSPSGSGLGAGGGSANRLRRPDRLGVVRQQIVGGEQRLGAVADQAVGADRRRAGDVPRHRHHLPSLVQRGPRRDQRAGSLRRFDHHRDPRQAADEPVPPGKAAGGGPLAGRKLGEQQAVARPPARTARGWP